MRTLCGLHLEQRAAATAADFLIVVDTCAGELLSVNVSVKVCLSGASDDYGTILW